MENSATELPVSVRVEEGKVKVNGLTIDDEDIVKYFSEMEPSAIEETFVDALKLGVITLKTTGQAAKTMYVERCFAEMSTSFDERIEETFGQGGEIEKVVSQYFGKDGQLATTMDGFLGEKGEFSSQLERHFGPNGKIVKEVFNPFKEDTPLFQLRTHLEQQFQTQMALLITKLDLEKQKAEDRKKTTQKGRDFEEQLEEKLSAIAKVFGDILEDTSKMPGLVPDCKEGDFVVTLAGHPDIKVVFEAKDREKLTVPSMSSEVKEAIKNRNGCYGVLISKYCESLPNSVGWFNEIGSDVLAIAIGSRTNDEMKDEILNIAYRWARAKALLTKSVASEKVDVTLIQKHIEEARKGMKAINKIKTHIENTKNEIGEVETGLNEFKKSVEGYLDAIFHELQKGDLASKQG